MTDKQLEAITSRLDALKTLLEQTKEASDKAREASEKLHGLWDKDREDFSNFNVALTDEKNSFDTLRKLIINLPTDIMRQVSDVLKPAEKQVKQLQNAIVDSEVVALAENKIKLPLKAKIRLFFNKFKKPMIAPQKKK